MICTKCGSQIGAYETKCRFCGFDMIVHTEKKKNYKAANVLLILFALAVFVGGVVLKYVKPISAKGWVEQQSSYAVDIEN